MSCIAGCVPTVTVVVPVHPFESVIEQIYVPGSNPVAVLVV